MIKKYKVLILLGAIILLGAWSCDEKSSTKSIEETTNDLKIDSGSKIEIRQTVLGLGAKLSEVAEVDRGRTSVEVDKWDFDKEISLKWQRKLEVETEESIKTREQFEKNKPDTPIGEDEPEEPEPIYEEITINGTVASKNEGDVKSIYLPAYWPEGDKTLSNNGLVWISRDSYQDLVNTRKTQLRLGLFDDAIAIAGEYFEKANEGLKKLGADAEKIDQDPYLLEAEGEFSVFSLKVNGENIEVQTIKAKNWYGDYVILNNPDNPIILKATLNPVSYGSLDLLSPLGILKSILGYEITEIEI